MTRYRAPSPKSSPHITAPGAVILRSELERLLRDERPKTTKIVHEATKNGDRSENGDYIYGKRRLREIDRRIRHLTSRLNKAVIVKNPPHDQSKIFFAAWIAVKDENGDISEYRIVGSDEASVEKNWISIDSPIAQRLLGKTIGDEVEAITPSGKKRLGVINIRY